MKILKTSDYERWFSRLKDISAQAKINARLRRIEVHGELCGDFASVGESVIELRFHFGPGYRIYVLEEENALILLLLGGDKSTQASDIKKAKKLVEAWRQK